MEGVRYTIHKVYHNNPDKAAVALQQFMRYCALTGELSNATVRAQARLLPGHQWWMLYGSCMAELQYVVIRVLAGFPGSGQAERNWKMNKWIHSQARNRLLPERAESLVRLHSHLLLIDKNNAPGAEEEFWPFMEDDE
jgi:hypothetical protein